MHTYIYIYIYIYYIYIYIGSRINLQTAAVLLFESSSTQLRSNEDEDLEGPEYQNAETTTRAVGIAYCLWLPFSVNRVLD